MTSDNLLRGARVGVHEPVTIVQCQQMLDRVPTRVWSGADGGFTTPTILGHHTWWFGDSITVDGFIHSSQLVQTGGHMKHVRGQVIPNGPDGIVYWPSYATVLADGRLLVVCDGIIPDNNGWFESAPMRGAYVTRYRDGHVEFEAFTTGWLNDPLDGNASRRWDKVVRDGAVLHFFCAPAETPDGVDRQVWHRAVPAATVEDPATWGAAAMIVPAETDGSWSPWIDGDGTWRAATMDPTRRHVRVYSAPTPSGPWTAVQHDDVVPRDDTPGENVYALHAHPWLRLPGEPVPTLACTVSHSVPQEHSEGQHEYRIRWLGIPRP